MEKEEGKIGLGTLFVLPFRCSTEAKNELYYTFHFQIGRKDAHWDNFTSYIVPVKE
jgi:hypothetical protein